MSRKETTAVALALACVIALAAQAGTPPSYATDIEPIFVKRCAECHGADSPKKGLDLSQGKGFANLLQRKSLEEPLMGLVKAGDPTASFLWLKLSHTATEGKGMPRTILGAKKLPQAQLDAVKNWIVQGAQP